jgi:hypothetical protein
MSVPECSPRVSVVIAVYGERFLRQALESVLAHTFADLEIIVVDDGSVDETAILKEFSERDARLKVMRQSNAGYVTASRHVSGDAGRSPEGSPDRKSAWASSDPDATRGIRSGRRISSSVRACRGLRPLAQDQRLARTRESARHRRTLSHPRGEHLAPELEASGCFDRRCAGGGPGGWASGGCNRRRRDLDGARPLVGCDRDTRRLPASRARRVGRSASCLSRNERSRSSRVRTLQKHAVVEREQGNRLHPAFSGCANCPCVRRESRGFAVT